MLVERFGIGLYRDQPAQLLPQGVRKLLDIAMALARAPRLLLLDEPTSGISVEEKFAIMDLVMTALLRRAHRRDVHRARHGDHRAATRGRVLAFVDGTIIAAGAPDTRARRPEVRRIITGERGTRARGAP